MEYKIFQMSPYIGEEEIKEIADSIRNDWITEGHKAQKFIDKMLVYTGAKYGVLTNNGTIALYLGLKVLDIGEGDEVLVSDFSFYASAASIVWAGAKPVFVDISRDDFNIDVSQIENKITERTRAVMPVHIYGRSVDMDPLLDIAKRYNLKVVEDACQGLGTFYKARRHTGTLGDVGCFSFYADKTITTGGEGGMVLTNDEGLYKKMKYFRNQGRLHSGTFLHPQFGVNFRMTDLQAGFGLAQFRKLDYIIKRKLENANLYKEFLKDVQEIQFLETRNYTNYVPFRVNIITKDLENLITYLEKNGIQTRRCFYPLHKQPIFHQFNFKDENYPNSIFAYENAMSLPVHLALKKQDIKYICDTIRNFYKKQSK